MLIKLILKDFRVNTIYLTLLFVVLAAISFGFNMAIISESNVESELYVLAVILSAMVSSKLFLLTEAEVNADRLIAGFPVTRNQIVAAKYLSSALLIFISLIIHMLVIRISSTEVLRSENAFMYQSEMWIISGLLLILSDAFSYPFYFRYGIVKGALMYGLTLITLMIVTVFILNMFNPADALHNLVIRITAQSPYLLFTELLMLFVLIVGGSISISINVFKNKDL